MIKQYIKQALKVIKENPLVNTISILGTAFSIAMILVLVLVFQINTVGYSPESNRDRMLYIMGIRAASEDGKNWSTTVMSAEVIRECFYTLEIPEAVSGQAFDFKPISLPNQQLFTNYTIQYTDPGFWKVFDFSYLYGAPFTESDFESGIPRAVIATETAAKLFGRKDVVGETILLNHIAYTICGVVKTASKAAQRTYADVYVPYTSNKGLLENKYSDGITGAFTVTILARDMADKEAISQELDKQVARYNEGKPVYKLSFPSGILSQIDIATGSTGFNKKPIQEYLKTTGALLLFLLLIPALNLISVVQSSVQKRQGEIGLRKAFGATPGVLINQILFENMVITAIGGLLGLALSFVLLYAGKTFLLGPDVILTSNMLFKPGLFLAVLLFAFLLNLLSAGLPALRISRQQIIIALNDTNNQ